MKYGYVATPSFDKDCLVMGVFSDGTEPEWLTSLNGTLNGLISRLKMKLLEPGDTAWQSDVEGKSLLLIHCGKENEFSSASLRKRIGDITTILCKERIEEAFVCLPPLAQQTPDWQMRQMILDFESRRYQFLNFKTLSNKPHRLHSVWFYLPGANEAAISSALAIGEGVRFTRMLANLPANECTPTFLGEQALILAQEFPAVNTKVMGLEELQEMGMGAFLAVSQGSAEPPRLIEIQYQGAAKEFAPVVLVGKGITFDSGGLSLKDANVMNEMKFDMAGAASVLGALKTCALLKLPINVVGLMACSENLPSGTAVKPGDVIKSMAGLTIEVVNTDAEGRLVLADALTYAERFNPEWVVDIATLTGAMVIALGNVASGFMTKDESLAEAIQLASRDIDDKVWRMPLDDDYQEALDSPIADMVNATFDRAAGSITAACFLSHFTKKYPWAHIDIAGTAWVSGKKRESTGRPAPLLIQLLINHADSR